MSREKSTHRGSFIAKTLSALVVTCALAAINTVPAAAQTATKLDCKNCITSKQIENGKIKGKDLKDGAVDSSKIEDSSVGNLDLSGDAVTGDKVLDSSLTGLDMAGNSVSATDLSNEAGANFAEGPQVAALSGTTSVVVELAITAPTNGIVIVNASGFFDFKDVAGLDDVRCSIRIVNTNTTANHAIRANDLGVEGNEGALPFGATRGFNVTTGTTTFYLLCLELDGEVEVGDSKMTAMFFPTAY